LEVQNRPIIRVRAKKLKEALNELVQNIWSKMDLEELGTPRDHEGKPLIHLIQVQEEPNSCGSKGCQI
jgi:hypothetical protein